MRFVIRHDRSGRFRFAALDGPVASALLKGHPGNRTPDSVVLLVEGVIYIRSDAVIQVFRRLGWPWRILVVTTLVPQRWRDAWYDAAAARRVTWSKRFGLSCRVPILADKDRFIDSDELSRDGQ